MNGIVIRSQESWGDIGLGYAGPLFPTLGGALFAAYTFGADMLCLPGVDYTGNGRDLVASDDAEIDSRFFTGNSDSYFDAPFDADELVADDSGSGVDGECAVVAVVRHALNVSAIFASSYDSAGGPLLTLGTLAGTARKVRATTGPSPFAAAVIDGDDHVDLWELVGANWTPSGIKIFRRYTGISLDTASVGTSGSRAGATPWRIGSHVGTVSTYAGESKIAALGFYNRALTDSEVGTDCFGELKKHLGAFGVSL